jgi:hypothetical protein
MSRQARPVPTIDRDRGDEVEAAPGVSRRNLIANAVLAGTAVVAAPALGRAASNAATPITTAADPTFTGQLDEPLVARILDPRSGVIDIFFGEEHIILRDKAVAARLARAVK